MTSRVASTANQGTGVMRLGSPIVICLLGIAIASSPASSRSMTSIPIPPEAADPHYTKVGFFDIHVCHWPDRPMFFLSLFSTRQFRDVRRVEVFHPDGSLLTELDLERYKIIKKKGKPEKRAFIMQTPVRKNVSSGWYYAHVTMKNGDRFLAKDYVIIRRMQQAGNILPPHNAEDIRAPKVLRWSPISDAKYYRVFIEDMWEGGKVIVKSKLLSESKFIPPKGVLKPGGWYRWRVHARDVNEHALLGDFNHGSLSYYASFSVADRQ